MSGAANTSKTTAARGNYATRTRILLAGAVVIAAGQTAVAGTDTWKSTTSNNAWLTPFNWSNNAPPASTDVAVFATSGTSTPVTIGINMTGTSPPNALTIQAIEMTSARTKNLVIGNSSTQVGNPAVLTLAGGVVNSVANVILRNASANDLTLKDQVMTGVNTMGVALGNATNNVILLDGAGNVVITSVVSGTGRQLTIDGSGSGYVWLDSSSNLYTGGTTVLAGELRISHDQALGAVPASVTDNVVLNGGRLSISLGGSFGIDAKRTILLGSKAGTAISTLDSQDLLHINGVMKDLSTGGVLVKQGPGAMLLWGANTYTGNTTISDGSIVLKSAGNRLPTGTGVNFGESGTLTRGTLNLNGFGQEVAGLNSIAGSSNGAAKNTVTSATAATLTLGGAGTYSYGAGTNTNSGVITGAIALVKQGTGTQTLGDANTYSGGTTLAAGRLNINHAAAIGTGAFTISGGTFDNTSGAAITLANNNSQNWNGDFTFAGTGNLNMGSGAVTLNASRQVTVSAGTLTVGGTVGGSGFSITKLGSGTLEFTGNMGGVTGGAVVRQGTLRVSGAAFGGTITVQDSGVYERVTSSGTLAGISSKSGVTGAVGGLGVAAILASDNVTGSTTTSMDWRPGNSTEYPADGSTPASHPPIPTTAYGLVSDVLTLSISGGMAANAVYVLELAYDSALLSPSANNPYNPGQLTEEQMRAAGAIYLAWLNGGQWKNATAGNTGGPGSPLAANYNGSYSAFAAAFSSPALSAQLGSWGVDTSSHKVWAVINHHSDFAVVPEPATLALLGLGGVLALRRRRSNS